MRIGLVALAIVALAGVARAQADPDLPGSEPVPPELLRGRTLVLEKLNCSVDGPGGYSWFRMPTDKHPELHTFVSRDKEKNHEFLLQVYDDRVEPMGDAKNAEAFLASFRASWEERMTFVAANTTPSALPVQGASYRFLVSLIRKQEKQSLTWIGYAGTARRLYCLSSFQAEEGELPEFNAFVKSFKLIQPVAPDEPASHAALFGRVALGALVSVAVVVFMQRRQSKAGARAPAPAAAAEAEEDDDTDAFKPKPVKDPLRSKGPPPPPIDPTSKGRTRRDAPRPEKPKPDEDSRKRDRPRPPGPRLNSH